MGEVEQSLHRNSTIEGNGTEHRACAECTRICQSLHWRKNDLSPYVSRFFKVLIGQEWNKVLLLPPKFSATLTDLVGKEIELESAYGEKWTVTLSSTSHGLAFQRGWKNFASDHNLTMGDFLVFNYIKGSHFVVQIYGRSGCEKNCNGSLKRNQCKGNVSAEVKPCENKNMDATKRLSLSTSVAPGTKSEPSATNRTQNSGGENVMSPCLDNFCDVSHFEVHESKQAADSEKSIDAGVGTSNPAHTGMRLQTEANNRFFGTENFNSNIFTKVTDVRITEKNKHLESIDDRTHKCEAVPWTNLSNSLLFGSSCEEPDKEVNNNNLELKDDRTLECLAESSNHLCLGPACAQPVRKGNERSSPCANEGALFKSSGQKSTVDHSTTGRLITVEEIEELLRKRETQLQEERFLSFSWEEKVEAFSVRMDEKYNALLKWMGINKKIEEVVAEDFPEAKLVGDKCRQTDQIHLPILFKEANNCITFKNEEANDTEKASSTIKLTSSRGELKKMVKKEPRERSEQGHGHAKRKRDFLESPPHRITNCKQVKPEPLDVPSSDKDTVSCLAVTDGQHLELPEKLPAVRFRKGALGSKAVLLQDQKRRLWPALYQERSDLHVLISNWDKVNQEHGIQAGDSYVFKVEDASEWIYSIHVLRRL